MTEKPIYFNFSTLLGNYSQDRGRRHAHRRPISRGIIQTWVAGIELRGSDTL